MAKKPKKEAEKPDWHELPDAEVMKEIFGPDGHAVLKHHVKEHDDKTKNDYRLPPEEG